MQKAFNIFEFFKSTLAFNLAISFCFLLFFGLMAFNYVFLTIGFCVSLFVKEVNSKNEYLFYFNNKISKFELWFYSWCLSLFFVIIFGFLFHLIANLF